MELQRKIMTELNEWKNSHNKMCLVVRGARQIGKTFIIKKFAQENYKHVVYINFWSNSVYKKIFDESLEVDEIIRKIKFHIEDCVFEEKNTVIILDEIQECDNAYGSLRFFYEDKRFDVIATGSLLGLKNMSFTPVGSVTYLQMHSLDFEEFLWANGVGKDMIEPLQKYYLNPKLIIPDSINIKMNKLFNMYMLIGGMPKAVVTYLETNDINKVKKIKDDIIIGYKDDIEKHADKKNRTKIIDFFKSIPAQLSKENTKFMFNMLENGTRYERFEDAINWMQMAGIIIKVENLTDIKTPLSAYAIKNNFKVYMKDIGLLISLLGQEAHEEIFENKIEIFKGAIFENIFADLLDKKNKEIYFLNQNKGFELDFVFKDKDCLDIFEIKSSNNRTKSLRTFYEQNCTKIKNFKCYKFISGKSGYTPEFVTFPHWVILFF